jgi:hypothetical protein
MRADGSTTSRVDKMEGMIDMLSTLGVRDTQRERFDGDCAAMSSGRKCLSGSLLVAYKSKVISDFHCLSTFGQSIKLIYRLIN